MNALLSLPVLVSAFLFILLIVAISLISFYAMRWAFGDSKDQETRDLAGSVLFRIASLHGLVLALVFAQELENVRAVDLTTAHEASMLGDVFYDLERYDADLTTPIRISLARYARAVVEEEWQMLADSRQLSPAAWAEWEAAYEALLSLSPETDRQERLLNIMLDDIRGLSELREERENAALAQTSTLFIVAALAGILMISAAYFTWAPTRINLALIGGFSAYTGLIIYFVVAFSNPYLAPGNSEPNGFERFLNEDVRALAGQSK